MSYPDLPHNTIILNGVDLATRFGMILLDGYTLSPCLLYTSPSPRDTR